MSFLKVVGHADGGPELSGQSIRLRVPTLADYAEWAALREESRAFLQPFEPSWPDDDLTRAAFKRRLKRYQRDRREDTGLALFLFARTGGALLGGLTLTNLRRGVAQTATLGYWMGARHAGRGHMGEAVRLVIAHAFGPMRLHRLEAATLTDNIRSRRLLVSAGFRQEGEARGYLMIDGRWRDHLLFALLASDAGRAGRWA